MKKKRFSPKGKCNKFHLNRFPKPVDFSQTKLHLINMSNSI